MEALHPTEIEKNVLCEKAYRYVSGVAFHRIGERKRRALDRAIVRAVLAQNEEELTNLRRKYHVVNVADHEILEEMHKMLRHM